MNSTLSLSTFKLSQAVLEVRYEKAYRLWDYSGRLWGSVARMWPNLIPDTAQPNVSTFHLDNRYQLAVAMEKSHIVDMIPISSLKDFFERAKDFVKLITKFLEVEYFTRVGFRLVYIKGFPNRQQAADAMLSTKMLMVPEGQHFGIQGKAFLPKYALVWEGESVAARILLEVRDKKVDFDPPPDIEELSSVHLKKYELFYDIDYYTLGQISTGQLDVMEWLSQVYHLVKRDSKSFLGGI